MRNLNGLWRTVAVVLFALVFGPMAPMHGAAQQKGKKEFEFKGKIEKVDAKAKKLSVNGENVQGWMPAMTMTYGVDKQEVIDQVKAGDQITAKVYEGDFLTLYDVKIVPPKAA